MKPLRLESLPEELTWINEPLLVEEISGNSLKITAGPETDWFFDPANTYAKNNAPVALFLPPSKNFLLSAEVTVDFESIFDAGVLFMYGKEESWAKLCFEYSPQEVPMIVSVVTQGMSDDCNSVIIDRNIVSLRVYRQADTIALHYSIDRRYWHLVRYFSMGKSSHLQVGFSAQSPTGQRCEVQFSKIEYQSGLLSDIRNGE